MKEQHTGRNIFKLVSEIILQTLSATLHILAKLVTKFIFRTFKVKEITSVLYNKTFWTEKAVYSLIFFVKVDAIYSLNLTKKVSA